MMNLYCVIFGTGVSDKKYIVAESWSLAVEKAEQKYNKEVRQISIVQKDVLDETNTR